MDIRVRSKQNGIHFDKSHNSTIPYYSEPFSTSKLYFLNNKFNEPFLKMYSFSNVFILKIMNIVQVSISVSRREAKTISRRKHMHAVDCSSDFKLTNLEVQGSCS